MKHCIHPVQHRTEGNASYWSNSISSSTVTYTPSQPKTFSIPSPLRIRTKLSFDLHLKEQETSLWFDISTRVCSSKIFYQACQVVVTWTNGIVSSLGGIFGEILNTTTSGHILRYIWALELVTPDHQANVDEMPDVADLKHLFPLDLESDLDPAHMGWEKPSDGL